jgi:hypothetical protein
MLLTTNHKSIIMKNSILTIALAFCFGMQAIYASVKTDIEKANKAGNAVFLVVTEPGNSNEAKALALAKDAQALYPKSSVVQMNRADKANDDLVKKYQVSGSPLPVILVIATNGVLGGGTLFSNATSQGIVALIPSAKKAEVLKSMQDGKSVFLVVSKKSMKKKEVLSSCETACAEMKENAKIVEVDFDDTSEKKFLNELKISKIGDAPQTYVINSQGQIAGSFTGVTDSKTLVATATKKPAGGCCPSGSNKSCGPTK